MSTVQLYVVLEWLFHALYYVAKLLYCEIWLLGACTYEFLEE